MGGKKREDILDALLRGGEDEPSGLPGLEELLHRQPRPTKGRKASRSRGKQRKRRKKKTTHYLTETVFHRLGVTKERINELTAPEEGQRVSKSQIIDQALQMVLEEFEQRGEQSRLVRALRQGAPRSRKKGSSR